MGCSSYPNTEDIRELNTKQEGEKSNGTSSSYSLIAARSFVAGWKLNDWFNWKELTEFCELMAKKSSHKLKIW